MLRTLFLYATFTGSCLAQSAADSTLPAKTTLGQWLFAGKTKFNTAKQRFWVVGPILPNLVQFNTVEGFAISESFDYNQSLRNNQQFLSTGLSARYGIGSHKAYIKGYATYLLHRPTDLSFRAEGGSYPTSYNTTEPIGVANNTITSLMGGQNFLKLYERTFANISVKRLFFKTFTSTFQVGMEQRSPLVNQSWYSFKKNPAYTSNNPQQPENDAPAFDKHQMQWFNIGVRINPSAWGKNHNLPILTLQYRKAWQGVQYQRINFRINQNFASTWGESRWAVSGGLMYDTAPLNFIDYFHFSGNESVFANGRSDAFAMLPYFGYSTDKYFGQGHWEQHFRGYFLQKIPLMKRWNWHETASLRLLYTPDQAPYAEGSVGLENILKIYRLDLIAQNSGRWVLRVGVAL